MSASPNAQPRPDAPTGRERLLLARKLAGSVKDQLYLASFGLPVELRWEEEGDTQAEFYLDQSGWFEGELRLHRGASSQGAVLWSGDKGGLRRALSEQVDDLRRRRNDGKRGRVALAQRIRSIEQAAKEALRDLEQGAQSGRPASEPVRSKLASIAAELEQVGEELE